MTKQESSQTEDSADLPEIVIGLVARIGTNLEPIIDRLSSEFHMYGYATEQIRVTESLKYLKTETEVTEKPTEARFKSYIQCCNEVRKKAGNDIFSMITAGIIRTKRKETPPESARGRVYIINQLKKPEEVSKFRDIYGDAFIAISCHCPLNLRLEYFQNQIVQTQSEKRSDKEVRQAAEELFAIDESQSIDYGQDVQSAFPLADCILDCSSENSFRDGISRFCRLLFGDPSLAPTFDEYANNIAAQAALRSVDLSRQVGAAIFDDRNMIISMGCNEVPKTGGGTYWETSKQDARDHERGYDINTHKKRDLVIDVVNLLKEQGKLSPDLEHKNHDELTAELMDEDGAILKSAKILDILEYGRGLHAEMNAITDASRINRSTQDAILYVTTFPCHNCAKHIVGAGIKRVFYLEPYPKSEVPSLYDDSICIDPVDEDPEKVNFRQYCGVTKYRYYLYSKRKLKDPFGNIKQWSPRTNPCKLRHNTQDFQVYEEVAVKILNEILQREGLRR